MRSSTKSPDTFAAFPTTSGRASVSGERRTVAGFGRVRVLGKSPLGVHVEVVAGSGVPEGFRSHARPVDVYESPAELEYFERLIDFLFGGGLPPGDRPPCSYEIEEK